MINHKNRWIMAISLLTLFVLSACGLMDLYEDFQGGGEATVEAKVQGTMTAIAKEKGDMPTETDVPTVNPTLTGTSTETATVTQNPLGTIEGALSYPSEFLPLQRVVAFDVDDMGTFYVTEDTSQGTYQLEVPPGAYYVLAYLINPKEIGAAPGMFAAYSKAVECGLQAECDDHSLVPVDVQAGVTVTDIHPMDWYLPPGEDAGWPSDPTKGSTGSIQGELGYPSEYIPPLRVVAFDVYSKDYQYVDTLLNQSSYEMTDLPAGTYHVVAYVREQGPDFSGGYSHFVTCGMTVDCTDHTLIDVFVYGGGLTADVNPIDFYAQLNEVDWPENPTQ